MPWSSDIYPLGNGAETGTALFWAKLQDNTTVPWVNAAPSLHGLPAKYAPAPALPPFSVALAPTIVIPSQLSPVPVK